MDGMTINHIVSIDHGSIYFCWFVHRFCLLLPPIFFVGRFSHPANCAGSSQALSRPQDQLRPWMVFTVNLLV
jgi:hypothetical protein